MGEKPEKRVVSFPFFLGRDGGSDPKAVRTSLLEAKNVIHDPEGALSKRPGLWKGQDISNSYLPGRIPPLVGAAGDLAYCAGALADAGSAAASRFKDYAPSPGLTSPTLGTYPAVHVEGRRMQSLLQYGGVRGMSWLSETGTVTGGALADTTVRVSGYYASDATSDLADKLYWSTSSADVVNYGSDSGPTIPDVPTSNGFWSVNAAKTSLVTPYDTRSLTAAATAFDVMEITDGGFTYECVAVLETNSIEVFVYKDGVYLGTALQATGKTLHGSINVYYAYNKFHAIVQENAANKPLWEFSFTYTSVAYSTSEQLTTTNYATITAFARFKDGTGNTESGGFAVVAPNGGSGASNLHDYLTVFFRDDSGGGPGLGDLSEYEVPRGGDLAAHAWVPAGTYEPMLVFRLGDSESYANGATISTQGTENSPYATWVMLHLTIKPTTKEITALVGSSLFPGEAIERVYDDMWVPNSPPIVSGNTATIPLLIGAAAPSVGYVQLTLRENYPGRVPAVRYDRDYLATTPGLVHCPTGWPLFAPAGAPAPSLTAIAGAATLTGTFKYVLVYVYDAGDGRIVYGLPSVPVTIDASTQDIQVTIRTDFGNAGSAKVSAVQIYRTAASGSNYHLVTTLEADSEITYTDVTTDAVLTASSLLYTEGLQYEGGHTSPPPAKDIWLHDGRVWLIPADDASILWYSRKRPDLLRLNYRAGEGPGFSIQDTLDIGPESEPLRGTSFGGVCLIFTDRSTYIIGGAGPDAAGNGAFLSPQRLAVPPLADANSLVNTGEHLIYKTRASWVMLDRGFNAKDIGSPVDDYQGNAVYSAVQRSADLVQVLLDDGTTCLVFDTKLQQWFRWDYALDAGSLERIVAQDGAESIVAQDATQLYGEFGTKFRDIDASDAAGEVTMLVETRWFNLDQFAGMQRVLEFAVLGQYKSPHDFKVTIFYDYDETQFETATKTLSADPGTYLLRFQPQKTVNRSFKVRIEEQNPSGTEESFTLTGFEATIAVKSRTHFASTEYIG